MFLWIAAFFKSKIEAGGVMEFLGGVPRPYNSLQNLADSHLLKQNVVGIFEFGETWLIAISVHLVAGLASRWARP